MVFNQGATKLKEVEAGGGLISNRLRNTRLGTDGRLGGRAEKHYSDLNKWDLHLVSRRKIR